MILSVFGNYDYRGVRVSEASLNGLPSAQIAERFPEHPYRFLVCADKFQTGCDEPLLHTMYVDKTLSGIKAVKTLSRLNRAHPKKHDVVILNFLNDADTIRAAFADFHRATILADETDPQQAARPAGGPGPRPCLIRGPDRRFRAALPGRGPSSTGSIRSWTPAWGRMWRMCATWTRTARWSSMAIQRAHRRYPLGGRRPGDAAHQRNHPCPHSR